MKYIDYLLENETEDKVNEVMDNLEEKIFFETVEYDAIMKWVEIANASVEGRTIKHISESTGLNKKIIEDETLSMETAAKRKINDIATDIILNISVEDYDKYVMEVIK